MYSTPDLLDAAKSTVLKSIFRELKESGRRVNIIAPTGRAALDINGSTFWTYAGWTPFHMKKPLEKLKKPHNWEFIERRLSGTDVLVMINQHGRESSFRTS